MTNIDHMLHNLCNIYITQQWTRSKVHIWVYHGNILDINHKIDQKRHKIGTDGSMRGTKGEPNPM